jgi:hypothetical protein
MLAFPTAPVLDVLSLRTADLTLAGAAPAAAVAAVVLGAAVTLVVASVRRKDAE